MFAEKPEISDNLEWMLQSRQVGDDTLVQSLVREHYAQLYNFGLAQFNSSLGRAAQLAETVLVEAVETAGQYRGDVPVRVWLFDKAIKTSQKWAKNQISTRSLSNRLGRFSEKPLKEADDEKIFNTMRSLDEDQRLVFLLKYHQGLNEEEIDLILNIQGEQEGDLNLVLQGIDSAWGVSESTELDCSAIRSSLLKRWPIKELSEQEILKITRKILSILEEKERSKHRTVIFGELLLILLAVVIVFGLGSVITYITPDPELPDPISQTLLVNKIVYITPTPAPTPSPTAFPDHALLYIADQSETLATIAEEININVEILMALNDISPDQPLGDGQTVMIGIKENQIISPESSIGAQGADITTRVNAPLQISSSDEQIRQRVIDSRSNWKSLWANAFEILYGPSGYAGAPVVRRQQIWISQPYFSYFVDGDLRGEIETVTTNMAGLISYKNLKTGEVLNNASSDLILFSETLQQLLVPSEIQASYKGEIEVVEINHLAGREVLVFDWYKVDEDLQNGSMKIHQGRYWIDTVSGVILRLQVFTGSDLTQLFEDIVVTAIEFDIQIPERLFDDTQNGQTYFAQNSRGEQISENETLPTQFWSVYQEREKLLKPAPPQGFDPAKGRLSFYWTSLSAFDPQLGAHADVFSNSYYLGNIEFVDPKNIVCTRSSDGSLIAFTGWSDNVFFGYVPLRWLDLNDLNTVHSLSDDIVPYDFAFAPDNRQLAVYGCTRELEQTCKIYIIYTDTGKVRELVRVEQGSGLTWSADGRSIIIQGSLLREGKWRVLAFSIQSGNVVYDGPFDWEGFWVEPNSPLYNWGVEIPPVRGGLEICAQPPPGED